MSKLSERIEEHSDEYDFLAEVRALEDAFGAAVAALKALATFQPERFDYTDDEWAKHTPETCAECKRWRDMKHPLQHSCGEWVRMFYRRKDINAGNEKALGYRMRAFAREALADQRIASVIREEKP